jgi:hypothetical protein
MYGEAIVGRFTFVFKGKQGVGIKFRSPDMDELKRELKKLGDNGIAAKHFAAAMRKALLPAKKALIARTPHGPTGNLRRAIRIKTKTYKKNGGAWAAVGYTIKGSNPSKALAGSDSVRLATDRGFHAHLVEFGTKKRFIRRTIKNPQGIASSYKKRGWFTLNSVGARVQTSPSYPAAFFKKPSRFDGATDVGQTFGVGMLKRTYGATKGAVAERMRSVMAATVRNAWKDLEKKLRKDRGL